MRIAFESSGDIRSVDLLAALVALWREKADASLEFSRSGATAGFQLRGGEIVGAVSSQPLFETAAILVRAGKLDAAALEKLQRPAGSDAAVAALQAGLITEREWRWGHKIRAIEVLSDLLGWLDGEYSFDPQSRPAAGDWTLPVPRLVLELFLRSRDRTLVEHYLGPSDLPLLRAATFDEEFETFGLTADAGAVVALIDGRASAEEVAERAPAEEFAVLKLLAALTTLGLVHPAEAAPEPRDETSPPIEPEEKEPEPERGAEHEDDVQVESEARPPAEEARPPVPIEEVPAEVPEKPARRQFEETETPAAAPPRVAAMTPAAQPEPPIEPAHEPVAPQAPLPDDLAPEILGAAAPSPDQEEVRERGFPEAGEPRFEGEKRRSAPLLAGLLAALAIAVVALMIVRSRATVPESAVTVKERTTAPENPVFPRAETAVPLSVRARQTAASSPDQTPRVTLPPTRVAALPSRPPTLPPTRMPTASLPPTKPPTRIPTLAPTRQATKGATLVPTRAEPTRPPAKMPTRPMPTASPARPRPTPPPTAVAVAGEATRAEWIARAERDRRALSKRRNVRYAVQLELACELPTLEKAWSFDKPAGTMWLLTTNYRGRTCFRVLWGRFAALAEAREVRPRVPDFFVAPGNRPTVVSVR